MADFNLGTARGTIEIDSSPAEAGVDKANKAVDGFSKGLDKASGTMLRTGAALGGIGVAAVAGFGFAVNAAANFEERISAIGAVSNATEADLNSFRKLALQLGADTKFGAGEAATAIEELAKAGVGIPDILGGAAKAVTDLAAAGAVDLTRAAEITANAMNAFSISGKDASRVADVFAVAANSSAADVETLGLSLAQVSAVAATVGLSFEDTIAALELFANKGLKGSDAGTSLKTMLLNLQPTTKKQIALFKELGLMTEAGGNAFFTAQGKLRPLIEIQGALQNATKGMTDQQKLATFEMIGGSDAVRALAIISGDATGQLSGLRGELTSQGQAGETAKKRMDNLKGSIEQLKGSVETALISIGEAGQGPVRAVIDFLTKLVNGFTNLSPQMQQFIIMGGLILGILVGMAGAFLLVGGGILKVIQVYRDLKAAVAIFKSLELATKAWTAAQAAFNAVMALNPIFLIIAGLVILGAALYLAYQRSEAFRNVVDAIGRAVVAAFGFLLDMGGKVVDFFANNWQTIIRILFPFINLPILIIQNWSKIIDFFQALPGRVIGFFATVIAAAINLGVQVMTAVSNFLGHLPLLFIQTFAFIIGFMVGFSVRMVGMALEFGYNFITAVLQFLLELPGRIEELFIAIAVATASWVVDMLGKAVDLGARFLNAIIEFFTQLPGAIWNFLVSAATSTGSWVEDMVSRAIDLGTRFLAAIVEFFSQLPGRVAEFIGNTLQNIWEWGNNVASSARETASNFFNNLVDGISGLPGVVGGILDRVISAFLGVIRRGYEAAKSVAGALWNGFKAGLGIGSPSLIEYAMWDLVDNVESSIKDLKGQIGTIQKMSGLDWGGQVGFSASAVPPGTLSSVRGAVSQAQDSIAGATTTFNNTFKTDADPIAISNQIMWDQRVRVRGN